MLHGAGSSCGVAFMFAGGKEAEWISSWSRSQNYCSHLTLLEFEQQFCIAFVYRFFESKQWDVLILGKISPCHKGSRIHVL